MAAQYKGAVRMGALNLLVLVIALCLVVLSVLALVSANSMSSFTEKQSEGTTDYYTQEIAGQSFLSSLDAGWMSVSKSKRDLSEWVLDGYVNSACDKAMINSAGISISGEAEIIDIESLYEQMSIPYSVRGKTGAEEITLSDDVPYIASIAKALQQCIAGVNAHFETEGGRQLNVVIGLKANGKTTVFEWKSTREWIEQEQQLLILGEL